MAVSSEPQDTHNGPMADVPQPLSGERLHEESSVAGMDKEVQIADGAGPTRRERRMAGKQSRSAGKIPTQAQYGVALKYRQHAIRRRG